MAKKINIKANLILSSISSVVGIVVPFITFPYFSRILMPEGLGLYGFLTSFVNNFYVFAVLGISTYGIICCSKVRDDKQLLSKTSSELFLINLVFSIASYSVLAVLTIFVEKLSSSWAYVLVIGLSSITTVLNLNWLVQAKEEYVFATVRNLVTNLLSLILLFIMVRDEGDLDWYIYINMGTSIVSNIINFVYAKKDIKLSFRYGFNFKQHLKPILLYFAIALATSIFMDMDRVILGFMGGEMGDYYVGIYEASSKINRIIITVITGTVGVLAPRLSYLVANDDMASFHDMMQKTLNYVMLLSLSAVIFIGFFGEKVVLFLLGDSYIDSIEPMLVLLPIVIIKSICNITNMYLMATNKEYHMTIALIIGAIINVIINVALIPKYNVIGVVIGTLVAESFVLIYQLVAIRRFLMTIIKRFKPLIIIELLIVSIPSMYVCARFIDINVFADVIIAGIIFVVELLTLMIINKDEMIMNLLDKLFRRKNREPVLVEDVEGSIEQGLAINESVAETNEHNDNSVDIGVNVDSSAENEEEKTDDMA